MKLVSDFGFLISDFHRRAFIALSILVALAATAIAHESPIDHVERTITMTVADGRLTLAYRLQVTERSALLELHAMDADADGSISDAERDAFFTAKARELAGLFRLQLDGKDAALEPAGPVTLDSQLGQTYTFTTTDEPLPAGNHTGTLRDGHSRLYPGSYRILSARPDAEQAVEVAESADMRNDQDHPGMLMLDLRLTIPPPETDKP